jgi:DNA invertase Pin-like site-specific DNA recombinase
LSLASYPAWLTSRPRGPARLQTGAAPSVEKLLLPGGIHVVLIGSSGLVTVQYVLKLTEGPGWSRTAPVHPQRRPPQYPYVGVGVITERVGVFGGSGLPPPLQSTDYLWPISVEEVVLILEEPGGVHKGFPLCTVGGMTTPISPITTTIHADQDIAVVGYIRVSTDKQDISPDVQRAELIREAERMGYRLHLVEELAASAATISKRPKMLALLADLKAGKYQGLMVSKLDRLSRNMEDGTRLLADSQRQGWRIICLDLGVDTATIMGAGMYNMALNFAEIERKFIGARTAAAMQEKTSQGEHMGRAAALPMEVMLRIHADRERGLSLRKIADALTVESVPTATGKAWYASTVKAVLESVTLARALQEQGNEVEEGQDV